ncbi:hypothetical protein [Streptomyces herbicida]|uniref:hypothetical protein n=1 Tax=Streptomyces herbicida TaxID=3065675 RepID=UPI00292DF358|nr:hypothetical protein [Streptomyces sp. NEAU-HV9]
MNSRGEVNYCGFPLTEAPHVNLPVNGLILSAQQDIKQTVLKPAGAAPTALQRAQELYALARRVLRSLHGRLASAPALVRAVLAECGGDLPPLAVRHEGNDAHNAAVGTTLARIIHDSCEPGHFELLTWLREGHTHGKRIIEGIERWLPTGPSVTGRLLASADSQIMLLSRIRYGTASPDPSWPTLGAQDLLPRASRTPAMLWPTWTMQLLPTDAVSPVLLDGFRRACATLLMLAGSTLEYGQAAVLLGNTSPRSNRTALDAALRNHDPKLLAAALTSLARILDTQPPPINYARRRSIFNEGTVVLDPSIYRDFCRHHGRRFFVRQYQHARWHLLSLLLGAHPGSSSRAPTWHSEFQLNLSADLRNFLHNQAAENLAARGIDEPVQWQPPLHSMRRADWPVVDVDAPNQAPLGAERTPAAKADHKMSPGDAHLLLFLEATGTTSLPPPPSSPGPGRLVPRRGVLAPDALRMLYEEHKLSQKEIAESAGCKPNTVRRALLEAGIPLRQRRPPGGLSREVSAEWLEHEYRKKHRSTADIGRELGTHSANINRLLTQWDIPRHGGSWQSNPFANLGVPLSPAMRRICTTRDCLQRLRRIARLPGQHNLKSAAQSLGISDSNLASQLRQVELAAGFKVIKRVSPLTPTHEGKSLLDEAAQLLRLLDGQRPRGNRRP